MTKYKGGRPKSTTDYEFYFYERNEDPVILEPPIDYKPMTQKRYQELINGQPKWREEFLKDKRENTYSKIYYNTNIKGKK
jgi:hypothetical protein